MDELVSEKGPDFEGGKSAQRERQIVRQRLLGWNVDEEDDEIHEAVDHNQLGDHAPVGWMSRGGTSWAVSHVIPVVNAHKKGNESGIINILGLKVSKNS